MPAAVGRPCPVQGHHTGPVAGFYQALEPLGVRRAAVRLSLPFPGSSGVMPEEADRHTRQGFIVISVPILTMA